MNRSLALFGGKGLAWSETLRTKAVPFQHGSPSRRWDNTIMRKCSTTVTEFSVEVSQGWRFSKRSHLARHIFEIVAAPSRFLKVAHFHSLLHFFLLHFPPPLPPPLWFLRKISTKQKNDYSTASRRSASTNRSAAAATTGWVIGVGQAGLIVRIIPIPSSNNNTILQ